MVAEFFNGFSSNATSTIPSGFSSNVTSAVPSPTRTAFNLSPKEEGPVPADDAMPESRVLVIMTGGTICMKRSENGYIPARGFLDSCLKPRPSFNDGSPTKQVPVAVEEGKVEMVDTLRTPPSKYSRSIRYAGLEFDPLLDSSSINAKGWAKIAKAIERNYQLFDSFVILHGTDSLAYTSSALSFMISNLGKPVILTGSQAPMTELHSDAEGNLLGSLIIAGHYMIPEVCLFFNHKLFRGNRATKVNAHDFAAFASPNHPPLAKVGISTAVNWSMVHRPSKISPFSIQTSLETSHVACLRIFPGLMPEMVRGILRLPGLRGLILETFGAGNAPEDTELIEVLREGITRGIVIVNVTQCQVGTVSPLYASATALAKAGVVFGLDMTTEAALTKLSCLLADEKLTPVEISRQMSKSLRGELTETTDTYFSHPNAELPPMLSALSKLGYAIQDHNVQDIQVILKEAAGQFLLNQFDYSGNTPLHLAAMGPNIDILRDFLGQGASVHIRNREGHTPMFLAAEAGREEHVKLLKKSGAHLHAEEKEMAGVLKKRALEAGEGGAWSWTGA
ncbi:asparaginase-domain-containing protein [Pyronema domesticum]|uniref:asparaginase n=1 Tax=Pyronema omphalodes (strain CBS 100304) TaxID=1076935 RepID=U4LQM6_PYROM|nr:asparaginase-domain-containing protein [Pyronema domesticum]CCX34481.1 Similar to 60 kDa lysophospholipase; acc. no. O88202 [Pyronema omphalodes CBS 100304]